MVLQFFRLLLNMTFKRLNQNASHYKKKCPLLAGTLKSPKIDGAQMNSTQIVVTLISGKRTAPCFLTCHTSCGHFWGDCPTLPGQSTVSTPCSFSTGKSFRLQLLYVVAEDEILSCVTAEDLRLLPPMKPLRQWETMATI